MPLLAAEWQPSNGPVHEPVCKREQATSVQCTHLSKGSDPKRSDSTDRQCQLEGGVIGELIAEREQRERAQPKPCSPEVLGPGWLLLKRRLLLQIEFSLEIHLVWWKMRHERGPRGCRRAGIAVRGPNRLPPIRGIGHPARANFGGRSARRVHSCRDINSVTLHSLPFTTQWHYPYHRSHSIRTTQPCPRPPGQARPKTTRRRGSVNSQYPGLRSTRQR